MRRPSLASHSMISAARKTSSRDCAIGLPCSRVIVTAKSSTRSRIKAAALMRERVEDFAVTMTLEQGKPIAQSRLEVLRAADIIELDAYDGRRIYGRVIPVEHDMRQDRK